MKKPMNFINSMMDKKIKHFHTLIDVLILLNVSNRESTNEKKLLPADVYLKQFCTVKCDIGREAGKTSYIKQRADEKSLVIVSTNFAYNKVAFDVVTARQIKNGRLCGKQPYAKIFIDNPSSVFKLISEDDIYKEIAHNGFYDQIVIQLGA